MTGRAAGYCAGSATPGHANPVGGRGFFGRGGGRGGGGRGRRNWFYATGQPGYVRAAQGLPAFGGSAVFGPVAPELSRDQELQVLKTQSQNFETALENVKRRIAELEAESRST
jgi:hypothetical protein